MASLWYDEHPEGHGPLSDFAGINTYPRPVQQPIPKGTGGHSAPRTRPHTISKNRCTAGTGSPRSQGAPLYRWRDCAKQPRRSSGRSTSANWRSTLTRTRPADRRDGEPVRQVQGCTASCRCHDRARPKRTSTRSWVRRAAAVRRRPDGRGESQLGNEDPSVSLLLAFVVGRVHGGGGPSPLGTLVATSAGIRNPRPTNPAVDAGRQLWPSLAQLQHVARACIPRARQPTWWPVRSQTSQPISKSQTGAARPPERHHTVHVEGDARRWLRGRRDGRTTQ